MIGPRTKTVPLPWQVAAGVAEGLVPAAEAARLGKLYQAWMKGVGWGKCQMTATNRPSLGSWNGWPCGAGLIAPRPWAPRLRHDLPFLCKSRACAAVAL